MYCLVLPFVNPVPLLCRGLRCFIMYTARARLLPKLQRHCHPLRGSCGGSFGATQPELVDRERNDSLERKKTVFGQKNGDTWSRSRTPKRSSCAVST